jgi:hypothetical protein
MYWSYSPAITGPLTFPAESQTWPVMTAVKYGSSTPFGSQKLTSVSAYSAGGGEFPSYGYTVTGTGFPVNKKVSVYVSSVDFCFKLGDVTANSSGAFTYKGSDGGHIGGVPTYREILTIWARAENGPAAIYSYKPTGVSCVNKTTLR